MGDSGRQQPFTERYGEKWLQERLSREKTHFEESRVRWPFFRDGVPVPYQVFALLLKATGLYRRGYENFLALKIRHRKQFIKNWPEELDGFRLAHLSDLHIELDAAFPPLLTRLTAGLEADLMVFTGDFREGDELDAGRAVRALEPFLHNLPRPACGWYGVLGNHDTIHLASRLEQMGIRILVNEALIVEQQGASFALAGVDDAYFYGLHDLAEAARQCPVGMPRILLSHSPQIAAEAAEKGFDLVLCGHTHGGQVCFPGGRNILSIPDIPQAVFRGEWKVGSMAGYTTTGVGACHIPVRFNCPPEIVIHILYRSPG